ncbi:MAG: sterol desaturase family protein [Gammaproteobacteria bacterium]
MTEILGILSLAFVPAFMALDLGYEARTFEAPRWYRLRMLLATAATFAISIAITALWGMLLEGYSLLDGSGLGTLGGAAAGILVYELIHYWYHRSAHRYELLWLAGHQVHHSAEKIDAFGANLQHPVDLFFITTWSALVFFPLLGHTHEAGALCATWLAFNAMFQHAHIRTPRWLGYLIQRPESHVVHHARGRHDFNYANLPLWDMVFGTFRNPRSVEGVQAGFWNGASDRLLDMLCFRDVSQPPCQAEEEEPLALGKAA